VLRAPPILLALQCDSAVTYITNTACMSFPLFRTQLKYSNHVMFGDMLSEYASLSTEKNNSLRKKIKETAVSFQTNFKTSQPEFKQTHQ
jgi:hypothetical protein